MFNPEKLLGNLLGRGLSGGGASNLLKGGIGMGLLGVALEAVEHFSQQQKAQPPAGPPPGPPPDAPGKAPATPFSGPHGMAGQPGPPPLPPTASPAPPVAPPPAASATARQGDAVLLIRAMIAAAHADGELDEEERGRILERIESANPSPEDRTFLERELLAPLDLDRLLEAAPVSLAKEVYTVSLLAVTIDSEAERSYLRALGERLGLSAGERDAIHRTLQITGL